MIQMAAGFSSLINGGYYYQPHVVRQIVNSEGMVEENIEKTLIKKTVSEETSDFYKRCTSFRSYRRNREISRSIEGYQVAGKHRDSRKTVQKMNIDIFCSFIGFAPYENPETVCYVVIDDVTQGDME
jgi:stage V sporulation protein D (sporulation-specific penicillin-binding protein)